MAISLTKSATERVRSFLDRDGGIGLRLGVRKTGCSGWAYTVDLATDVQAGRRQGSCGAGQPCVPGRVHHRFRFRGARLDISLRKSKRDRRVRLRRKFHHWVNP